MNDAICHRAFFALLPTSQASRDIEHLSLTLGPGNRVPTKHLHMTLAITDDYPLPPAALLDRMTRIAEELSLTRFQLTLDQLTSSGRSLALCPGRKPSQLMLLQLQLQKALALCGISRGGWRFNPHVTLLYREDMPFSQSIAPISWWVDELVLVHSHVGLTRHDIVGRWSLLSEPDAPLVA